MSVEMIRNLHELSGKAAIETIGKQYFGEDFFIKESNDMKIYKEIYDQFNNLVFHPKGKKGIFLNGSIGVGKTALMRIFQRLVSGTDREFKYVSALRLKDLSEDLKVIEIKDMYGRGCRTDLMIDDIGNFGVTLNYGNEVNIIEELIYDRYEVFISRGLKTHFTSNKPPTGGGPLDSIKNIYGLRCFDRMCEMCDNFTWVGESKR